MSPGITANFSKRFGTETQIRVDDLTTSSSAEITVLFGTSGSGKTTILRCLCGLERPDEGEIHFDGQTWFDSAKGIFLAPRFRNVGFVPQDYGLFPHMTVATNIAFGLNELPKSEKETRIAELCHWLGLSELTQRLPGQLSGGQQQRVALARAVARRPRLLLLDEPLSALDAPTRLRLRGELRPLLTQLRIPTILVTHDRLEALTLGDNLVVLDGGRIVQQGPVSSVFGRPATVTIAEILAFETVRKGKIVSAGNGLVNVAVGNQILTAVETDTKSEEVYVCIRAENVILLTGREGTSSARNHLTGEVRKLVQEGPLTRIELDCGFTLIALLTKQSQEEMALVPGSKVTALVKAQNIHLVPRV